MFVSNQIILFVICYVLIHIPVDSHYLGEHGLNNENPAGDPILPPITGSFEVELRASFHTAPPLSQSYASTMFDYHSDDPGDTIWFGLNMLSSLPPVQALYLVVERAGIPRVCSTYTSATLDTLYTFKFGVDTNNIAHIYQDGTELVSCVLFHHPVNVPRTHDLGQGMSFTSLGLNVGPLDGTISGLRLRNLDEPFNHKTAFNLMNMPGQPFGESFVASFYARFDGDLSSRSGQHVFDFGNGNGQDNIICTQKSNTNSMECGVRVSGTSYSVTAPGAIVSGAFAFWHFGFDIPNGELWIEKDGTRIANATHTATTTGPFFRRDMWFGQSSNSSNDDGLDGVVLGFRLDPSLTLTASSS